MVCADIQQYQLQQSLKRYTSAKLYLGCEANGVSPSAPYFTGKLSDFRFYYTALSDDDIRKLYNGK